MERLQSPGESKIPVKQPLGNKLVSLSQKFRASLGISDHPVKLLGLLSSPHGQSRIKEPKVQRPSSFHEPFPPRRWSEGCVCKRDVGRRVVTTKGSGTLRFLGRCGLGPGVWAGIELDTPHGANDGIAAGVRYFNCPPGRGIFLPQSEISFPNLKPEDKPPHPTPVDHERFSAYLDAGSPSVMPLQDLSRNSKNSSSSSLVRVQDAEQSKHSSFELDDSLGILTPDQMDDLALNLSDDLLKSPSLGVSSLVTQEDLTLVSLTDSERNSLVPSNSFSKFNDTLIERDKFQDETNDILKSTTNLTLIDSDLKSPFPDFVLGDFDEKISEPIGNSSIFEVKSCFENKTNRSPSVEEIQEIPLDCEEQREKDGSKSGTVPNSFVTSITSITSLDNGYQGDGEWSRPASRGADHSPSAHQKSLKPRMDPMTDSDFFTESDADMHDELVSGRGDRRAQVIDGTLYGVSSSNPPISVHSQRFSPTCEEMDSSGIYSDFERRPEELEIKSLSEEMEDFQLERCNSPTGSTRTFSSNKSDQSVKKLSPTTFTHLIKEQVNSIKNLMMDVDQTSEAAPPSLTVEDQKSSLPEQINHVSSPSTNADNNFLKKHKMPKRNVVSKIKTMITSTNTTRKEEETNRTVKKGRWDAVMSKISQNDDRPRLKEVKSRVFSGLGTTPPRISSTATSPPTRTQSPRHVSSSFQPATSTRSLRDIQTPKSCKGRRSRLRSSECLLSTPPPGNSQISSRNSSISDVSQSVKAISSTRSVKKRDSIRSGSPQNEVSSAKKPAVSSPPKTKPANGKTIQNGEKIANNRKAAPRTATSANAVKSANPVKDGVLQSGGKVEKPTPRATSASDVIPLRSSSPLPRAAELCEVSPPLNDLTSAQESHQNVVASPLVDFEQEEKDSTIVLGHLKHASLGVEALATLINHLVINYDAFSTPKLKHELEKTKSDYIQTRLQLEQASTAYRRLEDDLTTERIKFQETETQYQNEIDDLQKVGKVNERRYEDLELKLEQQEEEIKKLGERKDELELLKISHQNQLTKASKEFSLKEEKYKQNIADLEKELVEVQAAHDNLKQSRQLFIDSLSNSEKETKFKRNDYNSKQNTRTDFEKPKNGQLSPALKAALQRNNELESEVNSLRSVLELRCSELQELRRTSQAWQLDSDQLPMAKQTIANYKSKIQELTEKLELKEANELKLIKENNILSQSLNRGYEQNKRLSMQNEELTWKLKKNTKLVHVLANNVDQASYHSPVMREARLSHKKSPFKANDSAEDVADFSSNRLVSSSPKIYKSATTTSLYNEDSTSDSTCVSPVVKSLVEKEESIAWTLDMDEPVECVASRIIKRATSLRCDQSPRKVQERSRSSKSLSERSIKTEMKSNGKEVIVKDDEELDLFVGPSEITIDDARLRPKSDEELEMLRRVEESGGSLPKDLAGEAMVSGETSDNDSDMVLDDSPVRSPQRVDIASWHD